MAKYIYWLNEIHQDDIAFVGGKASNMGDMVRGLTVPPGFCLSTQAFNDNITHFDIDAKIQLKLTESNLNELQDAEKISNYISELILKTPLLPEVEDAITESFAKLSGGNLDFQVAVRSSATAEDLEDASFAGQQETFLNVDGLDNVILSVKKCWASLWTSRAIHYRNQRGFEHETVKMGVIVQEMVPASISGVMFTANPVNNSREQIRIEAVRGLGELLVSGMSAGDVYILNKSETNVDIISKEVSDPILGQMLNDYEIRELAHTGLKIEVYYDKYMDIEWAFSKGKFYFLQTRPITTLSDEELPVIEMEKMDRMQREVYEWVAERFPEPIYPIDGIVVKLLFMAQFEAMQEFGFDIAMMDWGKIEKGIFPEFFEPPRINAGIRRLWPYFRLGRTLKSDPAAEWAGEQVYLLDLLKKLKGRDISGLPYEIVTDYITEAFNHLHFFTAMRYRYFAQNKVPTALLNRFLKFLFKQQGTEVYDKLHAGVENMTLELNRALYELSNEVRENSAVEQIFSTYAPDRILEGLKKVRGGKEFLDKFEVFLGSYGDRETTMGLGGIASPTWQDSPEIVLGIIKATLSEVPGAEIAWEKQRQEKTKQAEEKLYSRLSRGIWALFPIKPLIKKIIAHSRSFTAFRENSHYDVTRGFHVFRILFIELGKRFVRKGILRDETDIFYLDYFEVKEIISVIYFGLEDVDVKALYKKIGARKEERLRRINRWRLRNIKADETDSIKGVPASRGIATGTVKIIKDPSEFHKLKQGDILVAPYTNPAWTPLFSTAAGLVAETGGVASHAAIIAREYGIPVVMGVIKATELFTDGEIITVNGATGSIKREPVKKE